MLELLLAFKGYAKWSRQPWMRGLLMGACVGLASASAHAINITCPAYPGAIASRIGSGPAPADPVVTGVTVTPVVGAKAVLCKYAVQVTKNYAPPAHAFGCAKYPLAMQLRAPDAAPAAGFTSWAFGSPGTPEGTSSTISAAQTIAPVFSRGLRVPVKNNCAVANHGVFTFEIYSNFPMGEACAATSGSLTCAAPPVCPASLKGSQIPVTNWSPSSSAPGFYQMQSAITAPNGAGILANTMLATLKNAMGTGFNGDTFTLPNGTPFGILPGGVVVCSYDGPVFKYHHEEARVQVSVACKTSCASL